MHDDNRDQFVDELLEASLKQYRGEEPRSGLEMRILAGVRSRQRAARRRGLAWAVAACAGVLAIIVLTLHVARTPLRRPTPSASLPLKKSGAQGTPLQAATPPALAMAAKQPPPSLGARRAPLQLPQQRVRRVTARHPRPEQFPTPFPITEQERLLLAYLNKATKPESAVEINDKDEAAITESKISAIQIPPLEIKPLDDSESEQGK